jgi:hypothetical protein
MSRQKKPQSSAEIEAQIRRLQEERERVIATEDQRRGALIRECLSGRNGDELRTALQRAVSARDAHLFDLHGAVDGVSVEQLAKR